MFWLIIRTIIYALIFGTIWYGGQFYITKELNQNLHKISPYALFVDQQILQNETNSNQQNGSITYPFSSIASALEKAKEKNISTIIVAPGTYEEKLILPQNITLYGKNNNVIISQPSKSHIKTLITADNTRLINLTISGGNDTITVPHNTSVKFINTTISNAYHFGVKMLKENPNQKKETSAKYNVFNKSKEEIAKMPLVKFNNVTITKNAHQGMYLQEGKVEILNSKIIQNGEEGIDLHPHMYATVLNTISTQNGESGLESEIYDNVVTIKNSIFNNNIKSGIEFITSLGIGEIILNNNTITNNEQYGIRCAVHKNRPSKPRPFFQTTINKQKNIIKDNQRADVAEVCSTF